MSCISEHPTATSPAIYQSELLTDESTASNLTPSERPGTPFIKRVSSVRLPDDKSDKNLSQLHELLSLDLSGHDDSAVNEMVDLTTSVFPDAALPFGIDDNFIDKCREYLTDQMYNWGRNEKELATFLNTVCAAIAATSGKPILRVWNASYRDTILEGSPIRRKPDVALLDRNFTGTPTWKDIRAIAEVTNSKYEHSRIIRTVTDKSYIMLNTQPNRIFVPVISTWNKTKFRLTVTDRQGQLRTKTFNIEYGVRRADLLILIRILVGLCFGNDKAMGYDPTIIMGRDEVEKIFCAGKWFEVIRLIYATQSLIGRATRVWEVKHKENTYILKDSWVEQSRPVSEATHLQNIGEMEGIPTLFCSEDGITINGVALSTGQLRHGIYGNRDMVRIRRRIVTSTRGSHIAEFRSKRELISAFRDIVITLKTLATVKNLVHRDISYNNILLQERDGDSNENHRRGLLIDLEYACTIDTTQPMAPGRRTGTAPFMAVELLLEGMAVSHRPSHDLESLFYVLVFICTNLEGPSTPRSLADLLNFRSLPLATWFAAGASFESLGTNKLGLAHAFEKRIVGRFASYFTDLKPCVMALFHAMYPNSPRVKTDLTHDSMIKILSETLERLPPHDVKFNVGRKKTRDRKRSLSIYDNCVLLAHSVKKLRRASSRDLGSTSSLSQNQVAQGNPHQRSTPI